MPSGQEAVQTELMSPARVVRHRWLGLRGRGGLRFNGLVLIGEPPSERALGLELLHKQSLQGGSLFPSRLWSREWARATCAETPGLVLVVSPQANGRTLPTVFLLKFWNKEQRLCH